MNWYEYAIIFGIGTILFFYGVTMLAKYLVRKDKIHQCKECGNFVAKSEIENHLIKKHSGGLR